MNKEDWEEWKANPVTERFLKYLKDSAEHEADLLKDDILNGVVCSDTEQTEVTTTCVVLNRIYDIELEEIEYFYEEK